MAPKTVGGRSTARLCKTKEALKGRTYEPHGLGVLEGKKWNYTAVDTDFIAIFPFPSGGGCPSIRAKALSRA
jgi:hypothetical protein